jgi:hypothetical protein
MAYHHLECCLRNATSVKMLAMIQMDLPAAFVCSQIFAYSGRHWLKREPVALTGKYTALSGCFSLGVIGACGLYLYSGWTEWEMMYWSRLVRMDTANFGNYWRALVAPLFLLGLGAFGIAGFWLAHRWVAAGHPRKVLVAIWSGVAVSLGMVLITPSAPFLVGHFADYHAYIEAARAASEPWDYGVFYLGPWTACIPFAASAELLERHRLVTFFTPSFFIPWLIDIVLFFGSTIAVSRWFKSRPL